MILLVITVITALIFDFLNGFHDAANSIATVVSTRVLSPRLAVVWAAVFNFLAAFFLGTAVAKTIGKGMIQLDIVTQYVVLAGLIGAIVWDLLTWWWGLPTSSSHALIGGYAGAAMARAAILHGWRAAPSVIIPGGWTKTLIFIVVAPLMGFVLGFGMMVAVSWIFQKDSPRHVDKLFRKLQLLSAAAYSLGHGGNDAQKTMGIVAGALYTAGVMNKNDFAANWGHWHWPIILAAHAAIAARHLSRRLAHCAHHGIEDHQAEAGRRILRRNRRRHHAVRHRARRNPRQHHAHHHRSHRRRRHHPSPVGRALGSRHAASSGPGSSPSPLRPPWPWPPSGSSISLTTGA